MKKDKIKSIIKNSLNERSVSNVYLSYDRYYYNLMPLALNDQFLFVILDDNFIFDGYGIFRIKDIKKIKSKTDFYDIIIKKEGVLGNIKIPDINLRSWITILESLKKENINFIIEAASDNNNYDFYIGRIAKIKKKILLFWHFDADGKWVDTPCKIPFSKILNIKFYDRYSTVFSKYIDELPLSEKHDK